MKRYLNAALIGAFCYTIYPIIIAIIIGNSEVYITPDGNGIQVVIIQLLLSMSIGMVGILLNEISFKKNYSLAVATIIHGGGLLLYVILVGFICNWFVTTASIISVIVGFIVIYGTMYYVSFQRVKKTIKETNQAIAEKKNK